MQAWILDESPGNYRWGTIELPELAADDVAISVVASALNHMDLWTTRGAPKPPLPHVPGCDVAGVVSAVGAEVRGVAVGDEVVVNPAVSPIDDIEKWGNDSPMGPGFMIYGEHCWGGHCETAIAPERNVRKRPATRTWQECAAFPLAYLTAYRMLRRARLGGGDTLLVVGVGSGVSTAAVALGTMMGARVEVTSRSEHKRDEALAMGAQAAHDSAAPKWPVEADVVVESVGPATWEQSVRALKPGGRMVVCGSTSGPKVELTLPRLFFKQYEIIGSSMGSYGEFDEVLALVDRGLPIRIDREYALEEYVDALERLDRGEQLGKIVLNHGRN